MWVVEFIRPGSVNIYFQFYLDDLTSDKNIFISVNLPYFLILNCKCISYAANTGNNILPDKMMCQCSICYRENIFLRPNFNWIKK